MRSPLVPYRKQSLHAPPAGPPRACPCRPPSLLGDRLGHLLVVVRCARGPGQDRALAERQARVRHDQLRVDLHLRAEPGAARAGAVRRVEGEHPRLELRHRGAAVEAGEALRVGASPLPCPRSRPRRSPRRSATAVSTESVSRLRRSGRITSRSTTTAMSCLNFLSRTISSSRRRSSPSTFTRVKPSARSSSKSLPYSPLRPRTIGARTMKLVPSGERHHLVHDLLGGLRGDRLAAVVAVRMPDPGPQEAQVVVDLGDRARPSSAGCARWSSGRSRWPVRAPRSSPRPACPSGRGTGARRPTATPRSAAGPRRRSCRTQGSTCRSPTAR